MMIWYIKGLVRKKSGEINERLDAHHIPSSRYIKNKGLKSSDVIAMEMQPQRHMQTRTYGNKNPKLLQETPREALGRDVKDVKRIFEKNSQYSAKVRESLKKVIKMNKENHPNLYKKGK